VTLSLQDKTVVIWKQLEAHGPWSAEKLPEFPAPVWRVSWSVTGNILAVSCGNDSVTLWKENLARKWERVSHVGETPVAK
jgi:protein transport protein SEC13